MRSSRDLIRSLFVISFTLEGEDRIMPEGLTRRWLADAIEFMAFRGQSMAGNLIRIESGLLLFEAGRN